MDFENHKYLKQIYEDQFPNIVYTKAAQCFPAGTMIQTPDFLVPIENIREGMFVIGHDGLPHKVNGLFSRNYNGDMISITSAFGTVSATPEHPFLVEDSNGVYRFKRAIDCDNYGMFVSPTMGTSEYRKTYGSSYHYNFSGTVYNFSVEGSNSYIANGYAVHNCGLSERMVSEAVWVAEQLGKVTLYCFPASAQLQDFTQARLDPVFQNSEYLKKVYQDSSEGVQKIELKKIGKGYIYLRGSQNEKQIISIDADCFDDQTEIYTENGWKLFKYLLPNEKVATLNKDGYLEYHVPDKYISYDYEGELISIENEQVNFAVKPTHDLYVRLQRQTQFKSYKAKDIYGYTDIEFKKDAKWSGKKVEYWMVPELTIEYDVPRPQYGKNRFQHIRKFYPEKKIEINTFLEFLGLFIAEGTTQNQHSKWPNTVRLGQNRGKDFDRICELIKLMGYKCKTFPCYVEGQNCWEIRIHDTQLAHHLKEICNHGAENKKIYKPILELDSSHLIHLYNGLMAGDGSDHFYSTISKELSENFEELVLKIGYSTRKRMKKNPIVHFLGKKDYLGKDIYNIGINFRKNTPRVKKVDWKKVNYKGELFCVEVKNHVIYTRRNNSHVWINNCLYLDERDRFVEKSVPFIDKRTLHSDLRWRREASTPTIPGFGIHASYMNSDQRVWQVPCPKCGQYQEIDLFKNVDHDLYICFCEFCKKERNETVEIDRYGDGKWVILNPEKTNECHGYKISGLYNPKRTIKEIVNDYQKAFNESVSSIEQFYNQTLGMPFHVEGQRISEENLDACKRDYNMPIVVQGAIAGCDVGSVNNMVVAVPMAKDHFRVVWAGTVTNFLGPTDSIESVMDRFNIKLLVIDAAPERRKVKELIEKYPGRVFAAEYPTKKFTIENYVLWDDISHEVKLDRTISLDYLVSDIQNQRFELPSNIDFVENFYTQLTSSVRVTIKNARTGEPVSKWVEEKADHYFHAFNYCRIALSRGLAGQALLDYYKAPEVKTQSFGNLARFIAMNGRRIF